MNHKYMDNFNFRCYRNSINTKVETYVPPKAAAVIVQKPPLLPAI